MKAVSWRPSLTRAANGRANSTGVLAPATQTRDAARCDGPGEVTRVNVAVVRFLSVCEAETVDWLDSSHRPHVGRPRAQSTGYSERLFGRSMAGIMNKFQAITIGVL